MKRLSVITILELFWLESDIDKASKQLYTAIYTYGKH